MEDLSESSRQFNGEFDHGGDGIVYHFDNVVETGNDVKTIKNKRKGFLKRKITSKSWSIYKSRQEDIKKYFDNVPESEKLICDVQCALLKDILFHGRLYICLFGLYFQANVFKKEIQVVIKWSDVLSIKRGKTAKFIPNAILIGTCTEHISFSSFGSRDKTFLIMQKLWQHALKNIDFPATEMNLWIQYYYGEPPQHNKPKITSSLEQKAFRNKLQNQLKLLQQSVSESSAQEPQHSSNDKDEERGNDESSHHRGFNLLTVPSSPPPPPPSSFDLPISSQDCDASGNSDVVFYVEEDKAKSRKSNSSVDTRKPRRCSIFPLKKAAHSRSFEHLNDDEKTSGRKASRKEKEVKDDKRRSLQSSQEIADVVVSDESGQESDAICQCGGHEELPEVLLDEFYRMPVNCLFKIIFHKNHFWSELLKLRKAKNVVLTPWITESGARVRNITYTLSLNYPFSPKHSTTTERQVLHADSTPGEFYLVDTECVNGGLPYGEDFYIANRYCISKISEEKCRIRITSQIKYKKNVWGLAKTIIEKNATAGILETFSIMGHLLRKEANHEDQSQSQQLAATDDPSAKMRLSRRKPHDKIFTNNNNNNNEGSVSSDENQNASTLSIGKTLTPTLSQTPVIMKRFASSIRKKHDQRWISTFTFSQTVKVVTALAMLLCVFNVFLFFKVHTLEHMTSQFEAQLERRADEGPSYFHSLARRAGGVGNIEQWKDAMNSLLVVMEEVARSVSLLERIISAKIDDDNAED